MAKGLKVAVVVVNIALLTVGLVLLGVGIWSFLSDNETLDLANIDEDGEYSSFRAPGFLEIMMWISVASGFTMVLLAVLAFFGVKKNSKWMLVLGGSVLVLVFLMMGVTMGLGVEVSDRIDSNLRTAMLKGINKQYEGTMNSKYDFSEAFDMAQVQFDCCGVDNYTDFQNAENWNDIGDLQIPKACCKLKEYEYTYERIYVFEVSKKCAEFPTSINSNIDKPCYDDIKDSLLAKTYALMVVSCLAALVQIVSIVFGCCLARLTKDKLTAGEKMYEGK